MYASIEFMKNGPTMNSGSAPSSGPTMNNGSAPSPRMSGGSAPGPRMSGGRRLSSGPRMSSRRRLSSGPRMSGGRRRYRPIHHRPIHRRHRRSFWNNPLRFWDRGYYGIDYPVNNIYVTEEEKGLFSGNNQLMIIRIK